MPIITTKHCQHDEDWWFTVSDVDENAEGLERWTGLVIKYHDISTKEAKEGITRLSVCREDALLLRDAINQLYPQN